MLSELPKLQVSSSNCRPRLLVGVGNQLEFDLEQPIGQPSLDKSTRLNRHGLWTSQQNGFKVKSEEQQSKLTHKQKTTGTKT